MNPKKLHYIFTCVSFIKYFYSQISKWVSQYLLTAYMLNAFLYSKNMQLLIWYLSAFHFQWSSKCER